MITGALPQSGNRDMDVITPIEPSLRVSLIFGLATFDKDLKRKILYRLYGWSFFALNLSLQVYTTLNFERTDLSDILQALVINYPHNSPVITLNSILAAFMVLAWDGRIHESLIKLKQYETLWSPVNEEISKRLRTVSVLSLAGSLVFCFFFVRAVLATDQSIEEDLPVYALCYSGLFLRYSTYCVLTIQVISYYSLVWSCYETINTRIEELRGECFVNDGKTKIRLLEEVDAVIKDFNAVLGFVYAIFVLLSCSGTLFVCIHSAIFFFTNNGLGKYEVVATALFVAILVVQICAFVGLSLSLTGKVRVTAHQVQNLLVESEDQSMKEEVEVFSLQLLHRSVEFTACGFFTLDFSLLSGMFGTIVTYFIILVEFETPSSQETGETGQA